MMWSRGPRRGVRGVVTVEIAVGIVSVTMLTACLAGVSLLGIAQASAVEAGAQIARQLARGDAEAAAEVRLRLPEGARSHVQSEAGGVRATVSVPVDVPLLGLFVATGDAWAAYEPGVGP